QLEDRLAKEKEAREKTEKAVKNLEEKLKKQAGSDGEALPILPGVITCPPIEFVPCPPVIPGCGFAPATAYGCFGECFPVITPCWGWGGGSVVAPELPAPTMPPAKGNGGNRPNGDTADPKEIPTSLTIPVARGSVKAVRAMTIAAPRIIEAGKRPVPKIDR